MLWRRFYYYRKIIGMICLALGSVLLIIFVPIWLWIVALGIALVIIGYLILTI